MSREICAWCGRPLTQPPGRGRPKQYCGRKCQRAALYRRHKPPVAQLDRHDPNVARFLEECGV